MLMAIGDWDNPENPSNSSGTTGDLIPPTWGERLSQVGSGVSTAIEGITRLAALGIAGYVFLVVLPQVTGGRGKSRKRSRNGGRKR